VNRTGKASFRLAAIRTTVPYALWESTRRSIIHASLARVHHEIAHPAPVLIRRASSSTARAERFAAPDLPSSTSAIIRWFLANGFTMAQIRIMFPGLVFRSPGPES
jgi:hypothetical protein